MSRFRKLAVLLAIEISLKPVVIYLNYARHLLVIKIASTQSKEHNFFLDLCRTQGLKQLQNNMNTLCNNKMYNVQTVNTTCFM